MAVKIGSARIDENGNAHSGKAGDQTGKEVSTQSWYLHSKGWRVFRAKNQGIAEKIAKCMEAACKNSKIGYDQWQRNTLYTEAAKVGFDVSKVTKACETDCSALVRVCIAYAGITSLPSDFRTGNMPANLTKTGAFTELTDKKYTTKSDYLRRGDILVTKTSGHTVVVLSNGPKAEEPKNDIVISKKRVKITGANVNIRSAPGTSNRILGIVKMGDVLSYQGVTQNIDGRDWYLVEYKNQNGWVSSKYSEIL